LKGQTKLIAAGSLIVIAVIYLIVSSTTATAHYFVTVSELRAKGQAAVGRKMTVSGAVIGDSIKYDASKPTVSFTIAQVPGDPKEVERAGGLAAVLDAAASDPNAPRLDVVYDNIKPDLLQAKAQAIIRGELGSDGRFRADEVLLKCPSKYQQGVPTQAAAN
jgi:cytochrome c-type biogenesis protein CcmE